MLRIILLLLIGYVHLTVLEMDIQSCELLARLDLESLCSDPRPLEIPIEEESHVILVLGMHRSGTSLLTGILYYLGVDLGKPLLSPSKWNLKGYFENIEFLQFHEKFLHQLGSSWKNSSLFPSNWLETSFAQSSQENLRDIIKSKFLDKKIWGVKDPRLCRLIPLWLPVLESLKIRVSFILMIRSPYEVLASLEKRDKIDPFEAGKLWLRYLIEAELATRCYPRVFVDYSDLINTAGSRRKWENIFQSIEKGLGIHWPVPYDTAALPIDDFISMDLHHQKYTDNQETFLFPLSYLNNIYLDLKKTQSEEERKELFDKIREDVYSPSS